jgi:MinD-like ATPase involved in chromosome partitioning or flagellar assembly
VSIVGLAISGDGPAVRLLERGGVDEILPEHLDPRALVQAIRFARPPSVDRSDVLDRGRVVAVVGARGAPGITEVAIAYAASRSRDVSTVLLDLDVEAPAIAIRLGLPPRPDLTDAADAVRSDGGIPDRCVHHHGSLAVVSGSHRTDEPRLKDGAIEAVVRSARSRWDEVVLDVGAATTGMPHVQNADEVILVIDASPVGIVRGADLVARWIGPAPALVVNRSRQGDRSDVVAAVRRWTGLEPAVVVGEIPRVRRASAKASAPDRRFTRAIERLGVG